MQENDNNNKNDNKQTIIRVASLSCAIAGLLGFMLVLTNITGITNVDWIIIGLLFLAMLLMFIVNLKR